MTTTISASKVFMIQIIVGANRADQPRTITLALGTAA